MKIIGRPVVFVFLTMISLFTCVAFCQSIQSPHGQNETVFFEGKHDFRNFYTVAQMTKDGHPEGAFKPALFSARAQEGFEQKEAVGWFYPPIYLIFIQPLTLLPPVQSFVFFTLIQWALLLGVTYEFLWHKSVDAIMLSSLGMLTAFGHGQNGVLTAILYIAAFRFLTIRPWLSGFFFACCAIKPHLGILVPLFLLAGGYYRVLCSAAICLCALILGSLLLYGAEPWILYVQIFINAINGAVVPVHTIGLNNITEFMPTSSINQLMQNTFNLSPLWAGLAQACATALCVLMILRCRRDKWAQDRVLSLVFFSLLTLLALPYSHIYDFVLAITACMGLALRYEHNSFLGIGGQLILLLIYFLPAIEIEMLLRTGYVVAPFIIAGAYFYIYTQTQKQARTLNPA